MATELHELSRVHREGPERHNSCAAALVGSWDTEAWAERQQHERVKEAMRLMEQGGAAVLMERIPAGKFNNTFITSHGVLEI